MSNQYIFSYSVMPDYAPYLAAGKERFKDHSGRLFQRYRKPPVGLALWPPRQRPISPAVCVFSALCSSCSPARKGIGFLCLMQASRFPARTGLSRLGQASGDKATRGAQPSRCSHCCCSRLPLLLTRPHCSYCLRWRAEPPVARAQDFTTLSRI